MTASILNLMTLCGASTGLIPRRMRAVKQYVTGQGTDRVLAPHTLTNGPWSFAGRCHCSCGGRSRASRACAKLCTNRRSSRRCLSYPLSSQALRRRLRARA